MVAIINKKNDIFLVVKYKNTFTLSLFIPYRFVAIRCVYHFSYQKESKKKKKI